MKTDPVVLVMFGLSVAAFQMALRRERNRGARIVLRSMQVFVALGLGVLVWHWIRSV